MISNYTLNISPDYKPSKISLKQKPDAQAGIQNYQNTFKQLHEAQCGLSYQEAAMRVCIAKGLIEQQQWKQACLELIKARRIFIFLNKVDPNSYPLNNLKYSIECVNLLNSIPSLFLKSKFCMWSKCEAKL